MSQYVFVEKSFIERLAERNYHPILQYIANDIKYDKDDCLNISNVAVEHFPGCNGVSNFEDYSICFESKGHALSNAEYSDIRFDICIVISCLSSIEQGFKEFSFSLDENSFNDDDFEILDLTVTIEIHSLSLKCNFVLDDGYISSSLFKDGDTVFHPPRYRYDEFFNKNFKDKAINDIKNLLLKNISLIKLCRN